MSSVISSRWTILRPHAEQQRYNTSPHRFNVIPAGRRSGKTELFKRKVITRALDALTPWDPRYFAGAPTRDQAKRIFWDDLKALSPKSLVKDISEGELYIEYINNARVYIVGMDVPERIEGSPWDGGGLDEFANMRPKAWGENVRPALSDRLGWCDLFGVPEGRNHYYNLYIAALAEMQEKGAASEWGAFHWKSAEILPASEIEAARRDLDEQTFQQEYEASFINFEGRAYYPFDISVHCAPLKQLYNPRAPLNFCFDFNVEPGVCAVLQELTLPLKRNAKGELLRSPVIGTAVIGEVHIPRNSNTPAVCRRLIADWGLHQGMVRCYGDATGGSRGSAKVQGSDWDLVQAELRPVFQARLDMRVKKENPKERSRINALNTRLKTQGGDIRLMVDPKYAPNVVKDLDGVTLLKGGSGELDKKTAPSLTHISDALGYYIEFEFPIAQGGGMTTMVVSGTPVS